MTFTSEPCSPHPWGWTDGPDGHRRRVLVLPRPVGWTVRLWRGRPFTEVLPRIVAMLSAPAPVGVLQGGIVTVAGYPNDHHLVI